MENIDTAAKGLRTLVKSNGGKVPEAWVVTYINSVIDIDATAEALGIVPRAVVMRVIEHAGLHRRLVSGNEVLSLHAAPDRERWVQ